MISFEPGKGPANDKEDVARVDLLAFDLTGLLHLDDGFHLRGNVVGCLEVDVSFLHQLEQVALDARARDIWAMHSLGGGDFVDFVDVYDAALGAFNIAVGLADEVADQVFDIAADIAGLAEFGGVALDERDADFAGDEAD